MLLRALILPLGYFKKSWLFGAALGVILLLFGLKLSTAHAANLSVSSTQDCTANSVIWCGVSSVYDLETKYSNGDSHNTAASIQNIYSYYGISTSDMTGMGNGNLSVVSGSVNTAGDVMDSSGNKIATDAITGGREDIAGSTKEVVNGTVFYERAPSVSFTHPSLPAYIVMKNGVFDFAILASCGNPVKATPVQEPITPPKKVVTTPAPTPVQTPVKKVTSVCSGNTVNVNTDVASQGGNCSTNTTVVQATPATTTPTATGVCSSLDISVNPSNTLAVTASANSATTNGAMLSGVTFNYGDSTPTTAVSTDTTGSHTYATAGDYTITATLTYTAAGQTVPASTCQALLTMATPAQAPPATPAVTTAVATNPVSTTLVNTGPGNVIAIFGGITIITSFGYHIFLKKKLS